MEFFKISLSYEDFLCIFQNFSVLNLLVFAKCSFVCAEIYILVIITTGVFCDIGAINKLGSSSDPHAFFKEKFDNFDDFEADVFPRFTKIVI